MIKSQYPARLRRDPELDVRFWVVVNFFFVRGATFFDNFAFLFIII